MAKEEGRLPQRVCMYTHRGPLHCTVSPRKKCTYNHVSVCVHLSLPKDKCARLTNSPRKHALLAIFGQVRCQQPAGRAKTNGVQKKRPPGLLHTPALQTLPWAVSVRGAVQCSACTHDASTGHVSMRLDGCLASSSSSPPSSPPGIHLLPERA